MAKKYERKAWRRLGKGCEEQGDYYCQDCTDETRARLRAVTAGLYLFSVALYGYGATRRLACNILRAAGATQGLVLVALFWFLVPLYVYLTAERKMTASVYKKASGLFKILSLAAAVSFVAAALAVFAGWAGNPTDHILPVLRLCGGFMAGGASMFAIYMLEKNMKYLVSRE